MMRILWLWPLAFAALSLGAPALAQPVSTTGSTTVVDQFALTEDTPLAFGAVLPPTLGTNQVSIAAGNGARSLSGGGNAALIGGGTSNATYTVEGDGGQTFDIDVPATLTMTRVSGSETIIVNLVQSAAGGTLGGTPGNVGSANFGVGGDFTVSSATVVGVYTGTFNVTVDNN